MTITFFLIRHAAHDNVGGYLAGRSSGVRLGEAGLAQAARLGARMTRECFDAIYASPRERTQETAFAIASASGGMAVEITEALDEVDFGTWSGNSFETLNSDPLWRQWNTIRSLTRTPGGENMLDVQRRVLSLMEELAVRHDEGAIVLVSHADVIKTAVSHVLGMPIDAWPRFDISPASITTVVSGTWGAKLLTLNEVIS
ncbi:phosphoglycerate mutase [Agaricicola taiwanensis]|uniref:Phosphoglycerate mutase n=1 Tax=Agaricicola taiwanensis TaxID=591372 RepID=A0A8J2VPB0_9RHOB|nr:histidine phosphatase family protein [Agaricicola taiwanensis]GGE37198.1 phosphoglycerate mutase [Agaricicola taiwanensis]